MFNDDGPLDGARPTAEELVSEHTERLPKRGLKPTDIRVDRRIFEVADNTDAALCRAGEIYQRAGALCRIGTIPAGMVHGVFREEPSPGIIGFDTPGLGDWASRVASFVKWDGRKQDFREVDPPAEVMRALLSRRGIWGFPPLAGFTSSPTIRPDGSILDTPGFDAKTGLFAHFLKSSFPSIPSHPTKDQASAALTLLCEIFKEFPYTSDAGRSVALSAVLTALIRQSLAAAPIHAFTAPRPRTGKSKQPRIASLIATGRLPATTSQAEDEAEFEKRLLGILLSGTPVISIDNIFRPLSSPSLCSVITEGEFSSRVLGSTNLTRVPTAITLCATGNNLAVTGDLNDRTVVSEIDPQCERPEEREFEQGDLEGEVRNRRHILAVAGLTIIKAYLDAGAPDVGIRQWGGFEGYTTWIRSPLVWLGMADPRESRSYLESRDPVKTGLGNLLTAWREAVGGGGRTVAEILDMATRRQYSPEKREEVWTHPNLREAVGELCATAGKDFNSRRLGIFIRNHQNRIENGLAFKTSGLDHSGVLRWYVVNTKEKA